jgi:hypothetical protein
MGSAISGKNGKHLNLIAFPNPFKTDNQVLKIMEKTKNGRKRFSASVKVTIFNYVGKKVFGKKYYGKITWSGFDSQGNRMAPGVYFVKMLFHHNNGGVNTQWYTIAIK